MTSAPDVVRLTNPADIASSVPYLLGFVPTESIVVVTVHGKRKRVGLTLRFDLLEESYDDEIAEMLGGRARHEKPREVYILIFTESPDVDGDLPRRLLYNRVKAQVRVPVVDGILVRGDRWWSYACGDPRCCPPDGGLIESDTRGATSLAAAHALHGHAVLPDRAAVVDSIKPLEGLTRVSMEQAVERMAPVVTNQTHDERMTHSVILVDELVARYRDPRAVLSHDEAAYLQIACHDVLVRDDILGRCGDDDQLEVVYRLILDVARRAVPGCDAPAWGMLAWAAYAKGGGVVVAAAVERALGSDADYSLAHLLQEALERQVPPKQLRKVWGQHSGRSARH